MVIPRIIHQTAPTIELPSFIRDCVHSLQRTSRGWDYRFYTDEDWKGVITADSIFPYDSLSLYPTGIQRSDIFRCAALHELGGCYVDVDIISVRSIDSMILAACELGLVDDDTEMIMTIDHPIHSRLFFQNKKIYMNNFMAAKPGARFLEIYLEEMKKMVSRGPCSNKAPVYTTGPEAISRLIRKHGGVEKLKISVVPYFWINPIPDMAVSFSEDTLYREMIRDGSWLREIAPYFVHCWWHSYAGANTEAHYRNLIAHLPSNGVPSPSSAH